MGEMKVMLYGDGGEKAPKEEEGRLLAVEAAKSKLLHFMCTQLSPLGFEARAARGARRRGGVRANARPLTVCVHGCADAQGRGAGVERAAPPRRGRHAARRGLPGEAPGPRRHARERARPRALPGAPSPHLTRARCATRSYDFADTGLITGSMLREALKHPTLAKCAPHVRRSRLGARTHGVRRRRHVLDTPSFYALMAYTDVPTFEVASDAFLTFKACAVFCACPAHACAALMRVRHRTVRRRCCRGTRS